jgi:hypothetical protein
MRNFCRTFCIVSIPNPQPNTTKAQKPLPTTKVKKVPETNHTPKPKNQAVNPKGL